MKPRAVDTRASNLSSIPNSQPIAGLAFVGKPVKPQSLKPKTIYNPNVSLMHQDGGNTGSTDLASPLGKGTSMTTYATRIAPFLWDSQGRLTTGGVVLSPGLTTPTFSLNAVDPETLQTLATWLPPDNQTLWSQIYQAGDHIKPGGFARGSGSTPTLLGHEYLAITDNANDQIGVLIYRQSPQPHQNPLVCRVPVFEPGANACDVGAIGHADGRGGYSAMVLNDYNAPPLHLTATDINGDINNLTQMAPGAVRVDVTPDGSGCSVGWDDPIRITSVPILSTATRLLYAYTQDEALANEGEYVWYVTALNCTTGEVGWEFRTGASGNFNDNAAGSVIGPDGSLYQGVISGILKIHDAHRV